MSDYISREELRKHLKACYNNVNFDADMRKATFAFDYYVENIPAADVQPVRRGRWIWDSSPEFGNPYGSYGCSECKERQVFKENYCPNCGARMIQEGDTE